MLRVNPGSHHAHAHKRGRAWNGKGHGRRWRLAAATMSGRSGGCRGGIIGGVRRARREQRARELLVHLFGRRLTIRHGGVMLKVRVRVRAECQRWHGRRRARARREEVVDGHGRGGDRGRHGEHTRRKVRRRRRYEREWRRQFTKRRVAVATRHHCRCSGARHGISMLCRTGVDVNGGRRRRRRKRRWAT